LPPQIPLQQLAAVVHAAPLPTHWQVLADPQTPLQHGLYSPEQ
jgi:hypothetical protein